MNINSDGSIELISSAPTTATVGFGNSIGYNNGVFVLNDICKKQYSNASLHATSRSLDILDIERKFNSSGLAARADYIHSNSGIKYGETKEYTGDNSNAPDLYDHVGTTSEEESKDYYTSAITATHSKKNSLTVKQTYYYLSSTPSSYFDDTEFHKLVFGTEKGYWLASRCAGCDAAGAFFGLRIVDSADLYGNGVFASNDSMGHPSHLLRPVVFLGADIKISTTGGTESSPRLLSL